MIVDPGRSQQLQGRLAPDAFHDNVASIDASDYVWLKNQMKVENPTTQTVTMDSSPLPLNPEQRKLYDTAVDQ